MQELEKQKKPLFDSLSDYYFSLPKGTAKNVLDYARTACDTYSNKTLESCQLKVSSWDSSLWKNVQGFYDILSDYRVSYVLYLSNLNGLINHLKIKDCYVKLPSQTSVEIKNCLGDRLAVLYAITSGDIATVTSQISHDLYRVEGRDELVADMFDKFINVQLKDKLVLFSDASSARTFSNFSKYLKEGFVYLATDVKNPNTGNRMDVATTIDSIKNYSSIPPEKRKAFEMTVEFYGLCGGSICSPVSPVSLSNLVSNNSALRKRGLIMMAYKEVPEGFSGDEDNTAVHPDLKNVFVIKTNF